MKAIIAAGLAVGLLGGCATESQLQLQAMETSERQADARYDVCVSAVFNSREFMPLQKHPRRSHDFTQEQMSDQSLATSDEVQAFRSVYPRLAACQNAFVESLAQSEPDLVSFQNAYYKEGEDDMLALTQRKISWGGYLRRRRDAYLDLAAAQRRIASALLQKDKAEREHAVEGLQALGAGLQSAGNSVQAGANAYGAAAAEIAASPSPMTPSPVAGAVDNAPLDSITQRYLSEMHGPQWSDHPAQGSTFAGHVPGGPDLFVTGQSSVPYSGVPTVMPAMPCCPQP